MGTTLPSADALENAAIAPSGAALLSVVRSAGWERALLACDFSSPDRPALVTALLAPFLTTSDGAPLEPMELWNLPVSTRDFALVRIATMLEGADTFAIQLHCPHADCRELLEVRLALATLAAVHDEHAGQETLTFASVEDTRLRLRRPTGEDLRHWRAAAFADESAAHRGMLRDLVLSGETPANILSVGDAFESFDPLLAFTLTTACPACHRSAEHALDLEQLAVAHLQAQRERILHNIHHLARAYGWTECEILAVPAARRARYLKLIEASLAP